MPEYRIVQLRGFNIYRVEYRLHEHWFPAEYQSSNVGCREYESYALDRKSVV